MRRAIWFCLAVFASAPSAAILCGAAPPADARKNAAGLELFEKRIRPALIQHCYECHSADADDPGGNLRLDSRQALLRGGEAGPGLVPGKPQQSLLLAAIEYRDLEMPPEGKLPEQVIADFRRWIALGAPDPRDDAPPATPAAAEPAAGNEPAAGDETADWWSLRPVTNPPVPAAEPAGWPRTDADRFLLSRLGEAGLSPNPDADPTTLIRRLSFDLTGLPPSPQTVAAYVADPSDQHWAEIVQQYLASPRFGERWGRHWLDVARYGESAGSSRDVLILYAWRYRDYVIDAFNADLPFDRFITEQIAGDLLEADSPAERDRLQVATGLLAIGSKSLNGGNLTYDIIDDQIDVVSKSVLGLTVSCARCHDHKFDPIPTADYYALAGIFLSTDTRYGGSIKRPENEDEKTKVYLTLDSQPATGSTQPPQYAVGVRDANKITDARILIRGEKGQPGEPVPRGFLTCIDDLTAGDGTAGDGTAGERGSIPAIDDAHSGRRQLAAWMVHPDHPLTARVAVNRIWQHLFGTGLVPTVDNFGVSGLPPTHPQLLDYLAHRFVHTHRWSSKAMIRELVGSRAYRMSSRVRPDAYALDPENERLWRMPRRRLAAEPLRDAMLAVSGLLDRDRFEGSLVMQMGEGEVGRNIDTDLLYEPFDYRSVYLPIIRGLIPEVLRIFDLPEPSNVQGRRDANTTPTQALYLMNSPFAIRTAGHFADSLLNDPRWVDDPARIERAYQLCFGRPPTSQQTRRAARFVRQMARAAAGSADASRDRRRLAWTAYCQTLLASAPFRYLD